MKAPRLHELTARVVAWHNRHPLAQRIDASQVHSIGEVRLPFASARPWDGAPPAAPAPAAGPTVPPPAGPTLAEALAQRNARQQPAAGGPQQAIDGLDVQSMLPEDDTALFDPPATVPATSADIDLALEAPAPGMAASDDTGAAGEAALVIPLLDGDAPPAASDSASPDDPTADSDPTNPDGADAPAVQAGPTAPDAPADAAAAPADGDTAAASAGAHDSRHDRAGTTPPASLPPDALPVVQDTVYPPPHGNVPESALARAVARRAAVRGLDAEPAHGAPPGDLDATPPAASRWQRLLAALRQAFTGRQPGLPPLRAAFSREFIWPLRPGRVARWAQRHGRPQPLAPADWPRRSIDRDPARLATLRQKGLAHDLPLHVLTAAIGVGDRRIRVLVGADGSVLGPRAYSRTRLGSASLVLAMGLVALGWTLRPLHGAPDDGAAAVLAAAPASATAPVAVASAADSAASATALAQAASSADAPASAASGALAAASAAGAAHAAAPATTTVAATAPEAEASAPQASIRPVLSDEERHAAKVEAARLRGESPPAPPATLLRGRCMRSSARPAASALPLRAAWRR
jgi:hypothetical protein